MMTPEQTLAELTAKICEAVPEIMELKFGCRVRHGDCINTIVGVGIEFENFKWPFTYIEEDGCLGASNFNDEILGSPITLEDVIRASRMKSDCYDMDILDQWSCGKPLSEQSPETISFLSNLLL